jgi:MFS family permease
VTPRARFLWILFFATVVNTTCMGARVNVPLLAIHLGAGTLMVGVLMGLFGILPALFSVHSGRWIDRVGTVRPMLLSALAMGACLALSGLVPTQWMLFFTTPLFALGFAIFNLAGYAAVAQMSRPEDRTANFSWLSLTGGIANVVGPGATGYLIDGIGHALTFGVLAAAPLATAGMILAMRAGRTARVMPGDTGARRKAFDLMRHPGVTGPLVGGALISLGYDVYSFLVPVYGTEIGLSASAIGSVMSACGLAVTLVRLIMPFIARIFTPWQLVTADLLLGGAMFAAFPFSGSVWTLSVLSFVYGVSYGVLQPVLTGLLTNASPEGRAAEALGLRFTLQNSMHAVIPAAFGGVGMLLGSMPVFLLVAGLMGAGGWMAQYRWRHVPVRDSARTEHAEKTVSGNR